jgi:multimeric flavodoxin WrbA
VNVVILGISASGRVIERNETGLLLKGVTEDLVKFILENSGEPSEYISLGGKKILGCQGCLKCAPDNICKLDDDWAEIRDRIFKASAIVFGAPIYYGTINAVGHAFLERFFSLRHRGAVGHAFLERFFSLRHRGKFKLLGKPNVIVTVGTGEANPAEDLIKSVFRSNYMAAPIGVLRAKGLAQCYTCGFGADCTAGAVVRRHGFLNEIRTYHIPRISPETYRNAQIIAKRLGETIRENFS